ncbi:MAG: bifunctional precorrin-2 dehydrogenase/sirohydrochlorin ferrochelatase [Thermodesulfovibrionales bacterium]
MPIKYYPAFLNLEGKDCVVIGGGRVAERKIKSLLRAGATVTVISPVSTENIKKLVRKNKVKLLKRNYKKGDLKKAFLTIAATSSRELHAKIAKEFKGLLNVVDEPELCNFIVPSVVKRGPLTIAISTSGASPAMAKTIRKEIERLYTKEIGLYLNELNKIRGKIKKLPQKEKMRVIRLLSSHKILKALRNKKDPIKIIRDLLDGLSLKGKRP